MAKVRLRIVLHVPILLDVTREGTIPVSRDIVIYPQIQLPLVASIVKALVVTDIEVSGVMLTKETVGVITRMRELRVVIDVIPTLRSIVACKPNSRPNLAPSLEDKRVPLLHLYLGVNIPVGLSNRKFDLLYKLCRYGCPPLGP